MVSDRGCIHTWVVTMDRLVPVNLSFFIDKMGILIPVSWGQCED